jgi:V/A-type H+/Na+-transporting ATPase subunit E
MSLQAILDKIRAVGDAQIQEVEKNAQSQASEILAHARMEAEQVEEDASVNASAPAIAERARIIHRARLDALRIVGSVRENLVDAAITRTREHLASFRSDSAYPMVLRTLTEEALAQLTSSEGDGKPQLLADPRDKVLMEKILKYLKPNIPVRYELNCWGGLIAQSEDGRVVVINTLESRLDQATSFLRQHLAASFEEERFEVEQVSSS